MLGPVISQGVVNFSGIPKRGLWSCFKRLTSICKVYNLDGSYMLT